MLTRAAAPFPVLSVLRLRPLSRLAPQISLISGSALFAGLSEVEYEVLAQTARTRTLGRRQCLFKQDEPVRNLFLLEDGTLKLTQLSAGGSEAILWLVGPGRAVGVLGMPWQMRHTCSAWSITDCRVLCWDWTRLEYNIRSDQIRKNLSTITTQAVIELEQRFREVATEKVSVRAASALVRMLTQVGRKTELGYEVFLSREELAQLTGTTLFTISRLVSKWSHRGFVVARREAIEVLAPEQLLEFASTEE